MKKGVIVGTDLNQEWLLPWWWEHYQKCNAFAVAFFDFGMSFEMKQWCKMRGELIPVRAKDLLVAEREEIDAQLVQEMELECGKDFWQSRDAWFKKPIACQNSPFSHSVWIDLDCQIRGSIATLFELCEENLALAHDLSPHMYTESVSKVGPGLRQSPGVEIPASGSYVPNIDPLAGTQPRELVLQPGPIFETLSVYNSGVIAFKQNLPIISRWVEEARLGNHKFRGDQDILNDLIKREHIPITQIPSIYNWSRCREENPDAIILHWHGPQGKSVITHQIMRSNLISSPEQLL